MLWYKGWLETRWRLLMWLVFMAIFLVFFYFVGSKPPTGPVTPLVGFIQFSIPSAMVMISAFLAGAGITTQTGLQAAKGLHGSIIFTLSLPVSRFRLLAVRAGVGWLEMACGIGALCCGMWVVFPALRGTVTPVEMLEYAGTVVACTSALYSIGVVLATFLDDQWRIWGTMIGSVALWSLPNVTPLPAFVNIFRAMGEGSPLLAHTIPWAALAFSLGLAAILFLAALKVVQTREF
jgi:hypothetical protein